MLGDIYSKLSQQSVNVTYNEHEDALSYQSDEFSLQAHSEADRSFSCVLNFDGDEFCFTPPDKENIYSLFSGLATGSVTIIRDSPISVRINGYDLRKTPKFGVVKRIICALLGAASGLFGVMMLIWFVLSAASGEFSASKSIYGTIFSYISCLAIGVSFIRCSIMGSNYPRRIVQVVIGEALAGFILSLATVMVLEDYGKFTADSWGALSVFVIFELAALALLIFSKKTSTSSKSLWLARKPPLPSAADIEKIFLLMDSCCKALLDSGVDTDYPDPTVAMHSEAAEHGIVLNPTLTFDELVEGLPENLSEQLEDSNIYKLYSEMCYY